MAEKEEINQNEKVEVNIHDRHSSGATEHKQVKKIFSRISRKTPRRKYSNWFLTINPNKRKSSFKTREEYVEFKNKFKEAVKDLHQKIYPRFILLQSAKIPDKFKDEWEPKKLEDRIEDIKIDVSFEIGGNNSCLHCHSLVKISHRLLKVRLNYLGLQQYIEHMLGYKIHFYKKLYRDASQTLQDYILKNSKN